MTSEKQLLNAIKSNSVNLLDDLLHTNLLFTLPNGQIISKAMDLKNYRSGKTIINTILERDQVISVTGDTGVVSAIITIKGSYSDKPLDGEFRYLRVWKYFNGQWRVVAGSCHAL